MTRVGKEQIQETLDRIIQNFSSVADMTEALTDFDLPEVKRVLEGVSADERALILEQGSQGGVAWSNWTDGQREEFNNTIAVPFQLEPVLAPNLSKYSDQQIEYLHTETGPLPVLVIGQRRDRPSPHKPVAVSGNSNTRVDVSDWVKTGAAGYEVGFARVGDTVWAAVSGHLLPVGKNHGECGYIKKPDLIAASNDGELWVNGEKVGVPTDISTAQDKNAAKLSSEVSRYFVLGKEDEHVIGHIPAEVLELAQARAKVVVKRQSGITIKPFEPDDLRGRML